MTNLRLTTDTPTVHPSNADAVLGGNKAIATAAVLGGHEKYLAQLFDLFNAEAKLCNGEFYRLVIFEDVALIGKLRRSPFGDLKVKVLKKENLVYEGRPYIRSYWDFAGYLKHGGALFVPTTASYDHARCDKELRAIAYQALIQKARKGVLL